MPERTDPWPHEQAFARIAIGILDRGEQLPPNIATVCAVGLYRITRNMEIDPCEHVSVTGVGGGMGRCDECGEWFPMPGSQP